VEGPDIHGSTRMEKVPGGCRCCMLGGEGGRLSFGEKVRRKVVSPLRCLTVRDMTYTGFDRLQVALVGRPLEG